MPTPSKGRIVLTFVDPEVNNGEDVAAAVIVRAWGDGKVNLRVLCDGPTVPWTTSVKLCDQRPSAEELLDLPHYSGSHGSQTPAAAWWPPHV
jgi:hypothetical protein